MIKQILLSVFLFVSITLSAPAYENLTFNGFIADNAQVISAQNETALNRILLDLQNKTKTDIAVVTLKSLQQEPIEDVALQIARDYKLGSVNLNNGALILVVPKDREARIEIGYGLEGYITDAKSGRILDDYMIPWFREGNYEKGIIDGTVVLALDVARHYNVELGVAHPQAVENFDWITLIALIIMLLIWGGGGFYGGFGGPSRGNFIRFGGGGGFGGGGASRRW